jgi:hypothetical protein
MEAVKENESMKLKMSSMTLFQLVDLRPGTAAGRLPVLGISASPPCHQGVNSSGVFCYSIAGLSPPLLSFSFTSSLDEAEIFSILFSLHLFL